MTPEQILFVRILSDHLNNRVTNLKQNPDWLELYYLAHIHQVEGIVYFQCKNDMPEAIRSKFEQCFVSTLYDYSNRKILLNEVKDVLNNEGISFFIIKGFEVAACYPHSQLRTMGDCDIVVHRKDVPTVVKILKKIGFSGDNVTSLQQWGGSKKGFHFEIHDRLVQEGEYATSRQALFFNNYDLYITNNIVDPSFHFLYLLMHLRKHFLNHGVGIRQFMDLASMCQNNKELNWKWIESQLQKMELQKFAHVCYALIEKWFYISPPVEHEKLETDLYDELTGKILKNGVFGFDDPDNKTTDAYTALIKAKGPVWVRRVSILMRNTFLSYEILRGYRGCEFVDGRPWLMPVAWLKRLSTILRRKDKSNTFDVINNSFISKADLKMRYDLLDKMGLL